MGEKTLQVRLISTSVDLIIYVIYKYRNLMSLLYIQNLHLMYIKNLRSIILGGNTVISLHALQQ